MRMVVIFQVNEIPIKTLRGFLSAKNISFQTLKLKNGSQPISDVKYCRTDNPSDEKTPGGEFQRNPGCATYVDTRNFPAAYSTFPPKK